MKKFQDKVVLITGAGKGIGRIIAERFASHGAIIAANDITPINLDNTIQAVQANGGRAKDYIADISKKMPFQAMVQQILDDWGQIDVLIINARVKPSTSILEMDEWDWRRTLDVNLTGAFLAVQIIGRVMRDSGGGSMLFILAQEEVTGNQTAYQTSLAGLEALMTSAAQELLPFHIRVNALYVQEATKTVFLDNIISLCSTDTTDRHGETLRPGDGLVK